MGGLTLAVALAALTPQQEPQKVFQYFMIVFASEGRMTNSIRECHTFATFVKATADKEILETHTISWFPATRVIRPTANAPERGVNLTLRETLEWVYANRGKLFTWGPFQIKRALYERAARRAKLLDRRAMQYIVLDANTRRLGIAVNCIHAVSDVGGFLATGVERGKSASKEVLDHLGKWIVHRWKRHNSILEALHLDGVSGFPQTLDWSAGRTEEDRDGSKRDSTGAGRQAGGARRTADGARASK